MEDGLTYSRNNKDRQKGREESRQTAGWRIRGFPTSVDVCLSAVCILVMLALIPVAEAGHS